jgi:hypothetical protein
MFKAYDLKIKDILSGNKKDADWKDILKYHERMILRIQHERLIHLLVTIFVGTVFMAAFFTTIITKMSNLLLLDIPLLALFVGYLFHYRFLENTTQNWYKLEDQIMEKCFL